MKITLCQNTAIFVKLFLVGTILMYVVLRSVILICTVYQLCVFAMYVQITNRMGHCMYFCRV